MFNCTQCPKKYKTEKGLNKHMLNIHPPKFRPLSQLEISFLSCVYEYIVTRKYNIDGVVMFDELEPELRQQKLDECSNMMVSIMYERDKEYLDEIIPELKKWCEDEETYLQEEVKTLLKLRGY